MTQTICSIRVAERGDIAAMHAIRLAVRENPLGAASGITAASYDRYVRAGSAWVAEPGGPILGFAAADEVTGSVWALFVAPDAEGSGVGRALHDAVLAWARGRGLTRLGLETAPGTRAERFYRKAGWQATGRDRHGQICFERSLL